MNIHVYLTGRKEPVKFYDTSQRYWYSIRTTNAGDLQIIRGSENGAIVLTTYARGLWKAATDVNHDPFID